MQVVVGGGATNREIKYLGKNLASQADRSHFNRISDGAQIDGVLILQQLQCPFGHHGAVLEEIIASPGMVLKTKVDIASGSDSFQNSYAFGHDFHADAIPRND